MNDYKTEDLFYYVPMMVVTGLTFVGLRALVGPTGDVGSFVTFGAACVAGIGAGHLVQMKFKRRAF